MKTASVRKVQHAFSEVLEWVRNGEQVLITRRNRPVARLVPEVLAAQTVAYPDFYARARKGGAIRRTKTLSQAVLVGREERI